MRKIFAHDSCILLLMIYRIGPVYYPKGLFFWSDRLGAWCVNILHTCFWCRFQILYFIVRTTWNLRCVILDHAFLFYFCYYYYYYYYFTKRNKCIKVSPHELTRRLVALAPMLRAIRSAPAPHRPILWLSGQPVSATCRYGSSNTRAWPFTTGVISDTCCVGPSRC